MVLYILDSYAWIEYFNGSHKGEKVKELFSNLENQFLTVECCLAEIKGWALRNQKDFEELFKIIHANSQVLALTEREWIQAATERFEQRKTRPHFGLIDATLLVKQRKYNCKIVSGDPHFKGLNEVIFLEE